MSVKVGMHPRAFRNLFGRSVRRRRRSRGLTQSGLARRAGISKQYLSRVELGLVTPSVFVSHRLARALGSGVDELVDAPPTRVDPTTSAISRLLSGQSPRDLELARRILVELFR